MVVSTFSLIDLYSFTPVNLNESRERGSQITPGDVDTI